MTEAKPTVGEQLAVINTKLDVLIAGRDDHEARIRVIESAIPERLEARLGELEGRSHQGVGRQTVLSVLIALIPIALWAYEILR